MDETFSYNILLVSFNRSNIVMDKLYLRHMTTVYLIRVMLTLVLVEFSPKASFGSSQEFLHAL